MAATPRHLLVRLPNPLGDAVLATPALRGLRRALPTSRITWAGRRAALAALEGCDERDGVVPADPYPGGGARAPWRAGRLWRGLGPDAVLLLPHSISSALAAVSSRARRRTGWPGPGRGLLLTEPVDLPSEGGRLTPRSMTRMYLDLAAPYGATADGAPPRVVALPFDRRRAAERLRAAGSSVPPVLGINPGAAFASTKVCPPALLADAVRRVRDARGVLPLVLCGPGEEALAQETAQRLGPPVLSTHAAPPDLGELKGLLEACAALLTTDAGPRHLAEALGTPTVVLMGPTDPRWTEDSTGLLVRHEGLDCLGCHQRECPIGLPCMRDLASDTIADALERALLRAAPTRR